MRSFITHIELDETEIEILVQFDYQPAEPSTLTYPGCDAEIDITGVYRYAGRLHRKDLSVDLTPEQLDDLRMKAFESMEDLSLSIYQNRITIAKQNQVDRLYSIFTKRKGRTKMTKEYKFDERQASVLLSQKRRTSHLAHIILSVITAGIWLPVYILVVVSNRLENNRIDRKLMR